MILILFNIILPFCIPRSCWEQRISLQPLNADKTSHCFFAKKHGIGSRCISVKALGSGGSVIPQQSSVTASPPGSSSNKCQPSPLPVALQQRYYVPVAREISIQKASVNTACFFNSHRHYMLICFSFRLRRYNQ